MGKSSLSTKVEVVFTKPNGERIEVEVGENGMLYIDVEENQQCTMNYAEKWVDLSEDRRRLASRFISEIAESIKVLGIA